MKITSLILAICMMTIAGIASAKQTTAPMQVQRSFSKQYKDISVKKWEQAGSTFVAQFKADKKMHFAYYLPDGTWLKTEDKIHWTWQLPKRVEHSFDHCRYASWHIDDIYQVEKPHKDYYTVTVFRNEGPQGAIPGDMVNKYKLYFRPDGTIYKTTTLEQAVSTL